MSPPRRSKSGINYRTWMKNEAIGSIIRHAHAPSVRTSARRQRSVALSKRYNANIINRNIARVKKMLKEIANYEARRKHRLVRQPSGSYSLARRLA